MPAAKAISEMPTMTPPQIRTSSMSFFMIPSSMILAIKSG
ncbi:Uncharacterised protein [Mycobacteroides abscessus subsp. abscessus]|nr:Uncharacterised protein [Mycobacteroides abscessus subsp. abscessus]